jgi:hypothetical protein
MCQQDSNALLAYIPEFDPGHGVSAGQVSKEWGDCWSATHREP